MRKNINLTLMEYARLMIDGHFKTYHRPCRPEQLYYWYKETIKTAPWSEYCELFETRLQMQQPKKTRKVVAN